MDEITNTMNTAAAADEQQPAVRVRVVDASTRQTMNQETEVVFVPCPDSEPIKIKNKALEQLPARRFLVKATAPGYAQLNYVDGPINIYHDHLVVDQDGRPQKEVVIMMERRVACCWLSVSDCRDGKALPTASVQLLDGDDVAHVFDAPGSHDVAAVTSVTKTYSLQLHLRGYVLHGPTTVTLERGKRIDLFMTARRTDVNVVCRDLRSGRRIDDVAVSLVNEANEVLVGDTVDTDRSYRIVARAEGFRQVTRLQKCTFPPKLFAGSTAPLEVRVDLEPVKSSIPLAPPRRAVWGWLALDQPSRSAPETHTEKKKATKEDWGTCTIHVRAVDATYPKPVRLRGARVRVDGNVAGETDERGALQLKLRAPSSTETSVTVQVEKDGFISDITNVRIQASQVAAANLALRRTIVRVDVVHASSGKPVTGDVDFLLEPDDPRAPLPEVSEGDGLVLAIKHDRATFDGVVAQRHRDESQTLYDVVGVDGSDVTLLKVRREDLFPAKDNMMQRELEIGENVACLYPHTGRYKLTCKAPGLRLSGPSLRTFSARDFSEKGPLQLTLRLEPSVARLRLACATEDGVPVSCLADVGGERLELSDDGSFSMVDVPLPRGKTQASVSLRVAAPQHVQVPPYEVSLGSTRATEIIAYVRPCDIKLTAVAKGNILKKATLQLIRVDANGDDDQIQVVQPNSRIGVDLGAEYRITARARGHRQVGLLKTFIATPETFLKQPGPVSLAVDMAPDVGAIDLAVLDVVGRPLRHARVTVTYERLPSLYLGHRRGVQELPLDGAEELEVDVTCDEEGYVQVSQRRIKVKAGRLRKTSIILRRSDIVLRAIDGRTGACLRALEDLRLELKPVDEGTKTLSFSGAGGEVFGPAQAVDLQKAYRICVDARRFKLVEPVDAVTFSRKDFGVLEDHKHLAPLLERARDAARRKARRSGVDADKAEEQLRLEIDARLAKVVDVRVECLVGDLNVEVIDARTGLPVPDISLVLKTSNSEVDLGLQRGVIEDIPIQGGGASINAEILVKSCDRVQLEPTHFDLRAGETNDIQVYVRDADVVVHCVDQESGDALIPDACYLEGGTTLDASDRCRVVVDRDYEVRCVVPRYRRLGSKRFRVTRDDFRTLTDVETPYQVVVNFEPCETDIDLRVEDAATGQVLSRAHVRIGPHSLGCTRGLESLRLPPSERQVTWAVSAQQRGWVLVAPRDVELHATPQHDDDPRQITILMRRCEVLVRCVDAITREPLDAHCVLEPANATTPMPWRLDDDDDACVIDVHDTERTGTIKSVGEVYDVALDDGSEELQCSVEELKREDGTEPSSYLIEERVVVKRPHSYMVRAACDGHRQTTHLDQMTFSLSDFAGLPVQAPLKLEVAMEAVAGVLDISVEDKRGAKIRSCEVWLDGVALGTQRGLVPINLPGGGRPHEARVDVSAPGYSLVGPSRVTVFAGCTTPLKIRLVATRCLIRVEDARDGAPIECRVCLVRERPRPRFDALPSWIKIGDRVEARLQGAWVEGTLEGEDPYAVQFDDSTIHNFERCDLRPVSTYDHREADPDLDPAFDGAGKNWCDWRSMAPLAIDCAPASYRVLVQDPQGEFRQVSHYEPVEFDVDELVKYKSAAREHANNSLARKLLGKKKRRPAKKSWSWFSPKTEELKPPPRDDVSDGDKHAKVALVVVQVAPRVAAAEFTVKDQSGKALKADVAIGGTNLGTRRGRVELDWCAIAPDAFLPPACSWRHAAGARADGSGVPCAVVATLDGYVQTSEDVVPFSSTGITKFSVEMRKSTLMVRCYDAATQQVLTDVAVDLVPLDGQTSVRWTAGSRQEQRVAVGRAYRVVARGGRLRQTTPAVDEDVIFGRADWAQLSDDKPAELRVLLERRVATVEVRVVDPSQQLLTHARCKVGATHFSQAEGWQQDVDLPCGRQAMREMPSICTLDDYLQLPPKRCDVFVGDAHNVNLVELRMRPLSVCLRASSCYDDKVIEDVKWRLRPVSSELPLVPLEARAEQVLRLGQTYVLECAVEGWRPCASQVEVEADSLIARFEGIDPKEPLPLDIKFEASSVPVRLNSISVENGTDPDARTCVVEVAGKRVPYGAVVDIPLPEDVDASQGCSLEVTASLPDASLTFLPHSIKCFPGQVTAVDCVFKALYLCVTIVDKMDHELRDASFRLNGGPCVKSGSKAVAHLGECTVECEANGCRQATFTEPLTLIEQDFIKGDDGFERSIKVVCAPKMATILVSVTDATTNEPLHRASIEMRHSDQIVWSSGGTPADRKGVRRAVLEDVPGCGDDVELEVKATLEGYTQIQPLTCLIRAGSANDQPWSCELLMRKYYVSLDVVDSNGKRIEGAGVELRSSSDVVAYQPMDVEKQAPLPIQLDTSYNIYPIISSLRGCGGEYFFRDQWHAADAPIVFSRSDFEALERRARESLKRSVMKSDDPRYPYLKRVCERPTWRALHAWIQAAGVKRSNFDVALPPLKVAVRACPGRALVDLRVVDASGKALSNAAVRMKTTEWTDLKQGVQDIRVPGGGDVRTVHFDALLQGHLLDKEHSCDLRATYDEDEPTLVLLKLHPLKLRIRVSDGNEPCSDARVSIMGGDGEEISLDNHDGVCETSLPLDEALVITASTDVTRHLTVRYSADDIRRLWSNEPGAPVTCFINLARANAHVTITVTDSDGKLLEGAQVDLGGQRLTTGDVVEVPPLTELNGCFLTGYVLDAPSIGWRVPTDADEIELNLTMRPTTVKVKLVDARSLSRIDTDARVTLTASDGTTISGHIGESLHITCDVPYDIHVTSSTDLKQVSHRDGVTFTPSETCLDIRVDVPSRLIVDVRDADTNAPLPDAVLALNGTIVNRGAVDGFERCTSLEVKATLSSYIQLTPSTVSLDPSRKTSLVVMLRACLVKVDVRGADDELIEDARIRVDDRQIDDWLIEPGREYALEVVSDGREVYRERVRFGAALFVDGPFTHAVVLNAASVQVDVTVVDPKGTPLADAEVVLGDFVVGRDRGLCDVPLPSKKTIELACRLSGFVLTKPRSLTIRRGETTTCRLTMRPATVTHSLEGAAVALVGVDGRVALPGRVVVGQTYTLTSSTHNVEERRLTFRDGDWDSLKGDDALEIKIGVATSEGIQQEESDLVDVSVTVVDADGGELPNASVHLGSVKLGTKRIAKVPRSTVPVKAKCPGYALVGPRSYDGAADLRVTMRRALVRARALVDGAELAGARVLFAKDDETPIELDCIDPDQSYAVTVALEDEAYRIVGATARWPGGSRSWNNPYVTVALPHDAWAESSQVQLDVMLVATKAELLVDIREEASGFPVHDATFAVSIGDAVTTFVDARGVLKVAVPSGRVDAVLDCEMPGCAAWSQKLSLRAGARCEVDVQMRRIDGDDASSASTRSMRPTTERTLDDVWAASRRCLEEAQNDAPRQALVRADLDRYVLLRPKTIDISYSNAVQPLTLCMRRCSIRGRCYDVRDGSSLDAPVEIEARDPERGTPSNGDVVLNASYALRTSKEGWRQVTSLGPVTPLARHFSGGDAKKPLDVFVGLEPTHVNLRVRVEPSDATITVQGVSIKSGPASLKVEELGSRWVKTGDGLALPLKVQATRDGYVASMTTIYARSMPHRADVTLKMRRAEICIRCVDASGTQIEDAIDVMVENERHSLKFGGMDEAVFTEWVSTQKKVNRRDRSPALQALLTNEDDVRNELFASGNEASSARVLEVFTARGGADGARLAAAAGRSGRGGVVVGASYSIRATHADYLCDEFQRRFDAAAFVNNGPLVVDVPLVPVYCDVILRVVDASTGNDITDGDASIHGIHLGQKRTARLRLFEHGREPLDPNVVVTHATYAQERCAYEQLRPLGPVTLTVRMRPTKILLTPMHGGEPVPLAQCSLVREDTSQIIEASGPLLIELGVAYKVRVEHATLVKVGDDSITFRAEQFLDEDLLSINVEMADKGASVQVEVVDEVTGDPIDCNVKLSGIEVGRSVDDVTWRRCAPVRATCMHKTMALVKAMLRVKRGDDATTDEVKASADGALVPAYAPKADERASLILKMRSLQFRVVVNHATDSSFVFDDASVTIAPRDPTLVSTLKVEKQGAGWLVSNIPPCANGYSVWCAVGRAAQAKACIVTLDELVRAPRNEIYSINVTMESIDGDVDLTVSDGEGSDVALGAHRVGGWRGAIRLIGVASGNLAVDAAADALVGECRVRAGSSQNVSLSRRRTVVDVVAKCDGALLKDARCSLIDQDGSVLDLPGSVVVSTLMGTRDGADVVLDDGSRIKVPGHLIREAGGRIKVPRRYYTLEVSRTGYRQVTRRDEQFAFSADQFIGGKHSLEVEMERCGAELSFDIVDSWGKPLDGVSLEVDGVPVLDGRCGVETGVDEVSVVATKKGYVQLAPENCTARIHGRDTRIRVALGSYRLHAAVVDADGRPINKCEVDVYQGDQCISRLGRFRRSVFVAPSLDSFVFRATLQGHTAEPIEADARLIAQHSTRAQAFTSVKFGSAFAPSSRTYSQRMYLEDRARLPESWPRQSPRETACRRLKCWDEMRAFFAWRLHAGVLPVSNEADVGRHGAVVIVVEKDAPVPAPAPAPEVTTAPVDEAPEKTARFHVVDVRTDAPLADARLIVDGAPQAQGIVASTSESVDVRCELDGYVQLGPTSHSLDTGTNEDMAAWATDAVELRMRPRDVRLSIVGEDGAPVEGVELTLTCEEASLRTTHGAIIVLNAEAYELACATPGWACVDTSLEVDEAAFRSSEEPLVRELRVERARVAVDVEVVDITGAPIPNAKVSIGGAVITDGSLPWAAAQGDQPIDVAFPEESWIVLRPASVNLEDASQIKVECRRCTCLVSVVEQYTQTTLDKARVTCGELEYEAGAAFFIKPGSYPLAVALAGAETVQAYTLDATPEAFSKLEDDQPIIVTLEMRATEALIDLRVEDEGGTLLEDATVTLDGEAHTSEIVRKPFTDDDERTFAVYASKAGYAFAGPSEFSVSRAKIGVPRELVVRIRPARVTCRVVDEAGNVLEDAVVRLTPPAGPEIKGGSVDVDVTYRVDASLRKYHRSGVRCDYGRVSREGDDFCISFTDADFARSSEPLAVEVTMEPTRCVIDLSLVEETPTEAVLDTVQVNVGGRGFSTDRRWSAPLSEIPERLSIEVESRTHVLVGPTFMNAEESTRAQTLTVRPALVEAAVYDEDRTPVEGADVWLKPVDDVHASSLVVLDKGTQQQSLVELGREYAVTCRKERTRCSCATFTATEDQLRALPPGAALKLEINARRTKYESVDITVRGLYDIGSGQDDPATLASVSINDDDMGPARGTKDVEAADATLSTSCSLRGWAQLPPYAVPVGDGTTPVHLEMVPALIRAVPSVDVDVECWLESDDGATIQVPTSGFVRVQVDVTYTLRARAPGFRLANKGTVTFTREQFWEASRRLEEPPSSSKPVVVDLELLMEPATCELALDVNNDDCTLTLERPGLPDLSLERGSQVVEGLPAATVSTVVRASLKGHAQLKPLEPITLAAAQKHAVSVELRPASVLCKCVDARTGAELVNARVRYEADGTVQYGSRRAPVVVEPATYRGCVIVESVGDAYRIKRDDGESLVVDSERLRGSDDEWSKLERGPPSSYVYEVNQSIISGKRHGTIASINDGVAHVAFEDGAADVDVSRLRPANYDFRRHLPSGLRCEVRTGGRYTLTAELRGWRQLDYIEPHVFENDAFVALGGPVKPEVPEWDASVTAPLSTSSKSLWSRFLKPDLGRALRTWHYGAEATRASRSMEGLLVAPPLRLAMRLVPGVGAVDLHVTSDGSDVDADISLIPVVKSDADPSIILGARRGIINGLAVAGAGEPALYKVQAKKFGYRVMEPSTISLRAGECTSVSVHLASCLAKVSLVSHASRKPFGGDAIVRVVSSDEVLASVEARDGKCSIPVDPRVACKLVVEAPRHEQTSQLTNVTWTPSDFEKGVTVDIALKATSMTLDVSVVDAATGSELPAANVVVGGFDIGMKRGLVDVDDLSKTGLVAASCTLDGYHMLPPYDVAMVHGAIVDVKLRLRRFEVVLTAARRKHGVLESLASADVALYHDGERVPSSDGVYSVQPGVRYAIIASAEGHRQASLTEAIVFAPQHFDDGLSDRLELTVELESELFEALVRVVDDETGAPLDGAIIQLDGFETSGPSVTGWRRVGKKLEGVAGPAAFLPCVAAAPRRVQASTARVELRNDGVVPCTTLRLRRASIGVRVLDDEGRAVQDPVVQIGLSQKGPEEVSTPRVGTMALDRRRPAPQYVRPRDEVLVVLDHFYDVRVVHDAMRQRDLLDPQRFEVMDFGRRHGDAALSIRMEPYRCAVDLKVVDAFGDDLPRARVRLGDHDLGTRRGVLDLGPNGAVVQPGEE